MAAISAHLLDADQAARGIEDGVVVDALGLDVHGRDVRCGSVPVLLDS
jgi:hypothetical protein